MTEDRRRRDLADVLDAHATVDDEEVRAVARLRDLLADERDPFARTTLPVHVTSSALVLGPDGRVLLHLHRRIGRWLQPGGHVEASEPTEAAALRETREETGLVAAHPGSGPVLVHVDEHPGPDGHVHLDLRYLLTVTGTQPSAPGEDARGAGAELRWHDPTEARGIDRSLARALVALRLRLA